jgi:hypothetical protein
LDVAQGNTKDMEATSQDMKATSTFGFNKEYWDAARPEAKLHRPIHQSLGAIVTSRAWIQLTGGYAR